MKTISLCMICGNEEEIILRCLESASMIFDELCLVRAIGTNEPDKTIELADKFCAENGKKFKVSEYFNKKTFPHVDNFGAARQQSFDLSTSDWCIWLDCDDIIPEGNHERILAVANEGTPDGEFDGYSFGYRKPDGSTCPRERLIKRGHGTWKGVIHETCDINGEARLIEEIEILHCPQNISKHNSHPRNRTLLEGVLEGAPRNLFYLHEEDFFFKDKRAGATGRAAMALLEQKSNENYEVLLNLFDLEQNKAHLWEAIRIQPYRREAWGYLCQEALLRCDALESSVFFRLMDALPVPQPIPWTHRAIFYPGGWGRAWLRVRVRQLINPDAAQKEHETNMLDPVYARHVTELIEPPSALTEPQKTG